MNPNILICGKTGAGKTSLVQAVTHAGTVPDDRRLVGQIRFQCFHYIIQFFFACVDGEINGLGQVKAEDSHHGFGVNYISSGYQVKIIVEFGDIIDKRFYFIDGV